jgi:polar amino acid transport system substrate-binding protein
MIRTGIFRCLPALLILVAVVLTAGCRERHAGKDALVVGMELAYPPFEMTDEKGSPKGVSVDLANELGKALGKKIVIRNTAFDGLIPSLITSKIDLIISSMTITEERKKTIDFSDPYLTTGLCLLVGKNSPINGGDDLDKPGITLAVKKGTTGHIYADHKLKNAKLLVLDREAAAVLEVVQGKADAFIYDQMSTYQNWKKNPDTTRALLNPILQEKWGIALRKGDEQLKGQVNRFLKSFREQGGFERLGETYLKEQKQAFKKLNYPFLF